MTARKHSQKITAGIVPAFLRNFRIFATIVLVLGIVMALPLFMVWKQVYVRENAIARQALADNCAQAKSEIMRLKLACESLSHTERIESIARARGLEYPAASRIVFVKTEPEPKIATGAVDQFLVLVRRSLAHSKG